LLNFFESDKKSFVHSCEHIFVLHFEERKDVLEFVAFVIFKNSDCDVGWLVLDKEVENCSQEICCFYNFRFSMKNFLICVYEYKPSKVLEHESLIPSNTHQIAMPFLHSSHIQLVEYLFILRINLQQKWKFLCQLLNFFLDFQIKVYCSNEILKDINKFLNANGKSGKVFWKLLCDFRPSNYLCKRQTNSPYLFSFYIGQYLRFRGYQYRGVHHSLEFCGLILRK